MSAVIVVGIPPGPLPSNIPSGISTGDEVESTPDDPRLVIGFREFEDIDAFDDDAPEAVLPLLDPLAFTDPVNFLLEVNLENILRELLF